MLGLFKTDDCKPNEDSKDVQTSVDRQKSENGRQSSEVQKIQPVPRINGNSNPSEPKSETETFSKEIMKSGKIPTDVTVKIFNVLQNIIINNCDYKPVTLEPNNSKINDITPNNNAQISVYECSKEKQYSLIGPEKSGKGVTKSPVNSCNSVSRDSFVEPVVPPVKSCEISNRNFSDMALFVTEDVIDHIRTVYNDVNNYEEVVFKCKMSESDENDVVLLQIVKKINFYVTFIDDRNTDKSSNSCMISLTPTSDASILCTYKCNRPFRKVIDAVTDDEESLLTDEDEDVGELSDISDNDEVSSVSKDMIGKSDSNEVPSDGKYNLRHLKIDFRSLVGANSSSYNEDCVKVDTVRKSNNISGKKRATHNHIQSKSKKFKLSNKNLLVYNNNKNSNTIKEEDMFTNSIDDILSYHRLVSRNSLNRYKTVKSSCMDDNKKLFDIKELKIVLKKCDNLIKYDDKSKTRGVFRCSSSPDGKTGRRNQRFDESADDPNEETIENIQLFINSGFNDRKETHTYVDPVETFSKSNDTKGFSKGVPDESKPLIITDVRGNVTEHLIGGVPCNEISTRQSEKNKQDRINGKEVVENVLDTQNYKDDVKSEEWINYKEVAGSEVTEAAENIDEFDTKTGDSGDEIKDEKSSVIDKTSNHDIHGGDNLNRFNKMTVITTYDKLTAREDVPCTDYKGSVDELTVPDVMYKEDDNIRVDTRIYAYVEDTDTSESYVTTKAGASDESTFLCTDYGKAQTNEVSGNRTVKVLYDEKGTGVLTEEIYTTGGSVEVAMDKTCDEDKLFENGGEGFTAKGIDDIVDNVKVINCISDDVACDEDNIVLEHGNDVVIVKQNVEGVMELDLVDEEEDAEYVNNDDQVVIIKRALDDIINEDLEDEEEDFDITPGFVYEDGSDINDEKTGLVDKTDCFKKLTLDGNIIKVSVDDNNDDDEDESRGSSMKMITCKICKKEITKESLRRHLYRHSGVKFCPFCSKSYNNNTEYYNHIRSHKDNKGNEKYMCYLCKKKFCFVKNIYKHMLTVHKENTDKDTIILLPDNGNNNKNDIFFAKEKKEKKRILVNCMYCSQYVSSIYYKRHLLTHTGERPFVCNICGKRFFENSTLKNHMRTHTGERPYKCEHCLKTFGHISTLSKHLNTHTGSKRYPCSICSKLMSSSYNLKLHMRIHTGEKPFNCDWCGKKFTAKSGLEKHIASMHR